MQYEPYRKPVSELLWRISLPYLERAADGSERVGTGVGPPIPEDV